MPVSFLDMLFLTYRHGIMKMPHTYILDLLCLSLKYLDFKLIKKVPTVTQSANLDNNLELCEQLQNR